MAFRKTKSIDEIPTFTEISIEYGRLLTQGVLGSFIKGYDANRKRRIRKNYDTAANAAYSAGQWEQINENKDVFPYLRYVTMQDDKVREEHWALHNLIYPVDDPFWDNYMPPNGWNCRCSVEQLMQSELPRDYSPMGPDSPVIVDPKFMNNPGKANALLYLESLNAKQIPWDEAGFPPMNGAPH